MPIFGQLYIVSTPIGNLEDISIRALNVLKEVDLIACENTGLSRRLLKKYDISTKTIKYSDHNESYKSSKIIDLIEEGQSIALISDAGTPCISDPGYRLVNKANRKNIKVNSIPGPSSVISSLSVSGLPTDRFMFLGFVPKKKGRKKFLKYMADIKSSTFVVFESPIRFIKLLNDIKIYLGNRIISVCREITKVYDEVYLGTVEECITHFSKKTVKGEITIVISKEGYTL